MYMEATSLKTAFEKNEKRIYALQIATVSARRSRKIRSVALWDQVQEVPSFPLRNRSLVYPALLDPLYGRSLMTLQSRKDGAHLPNETPALLLDGPMMWQRWHSRAIRNTSPFARQPLDMAKLVLSRQTLYQRRCLMILWNSKDRAFLLDNMGTCLLANLQLGCRPEPKSFEIHG